jgi:hypothetical protein
LDIAPTVTYKRQEQRFSRCASCVRKSCCAHEVLLFNARVAAVVGGQEDNDREANNLWERTTLLLSLLILKLGCIALSSTHTTRDQSSALLCISSPVVHLVAVVLTPFFAVDFSLPAMGVFGLQSYLEAQNLHSLVDLALLPVLAVGESREIVVDGCALARSMCPPHFDWIRGGQFRRIFLEVQAFVERFRTVGVSLTVMFDGSVEGGKRAVWIARRRQEAKRAGKILAFLKQQEELKEGIAARPPHQLWLLPIGSLTTVARAFSSCGANVLYSIGEADREIADYCTRQRCYGVLSQDSDFYIFDVPRYFHLESYSKRQSGGLTLKCFERSALLRFFGVEAEKLPFLATLVSNDFFSKTKAQRLQWQIIKRYGRPPAGLPVGPPATSESSQVAGPSIASPVSSTGGSSPGASSEPAASTAASTAADITPPVGSAPLSAPIPPSGPQSPPVPPASPAPPTPEPFAPIELVVPAVLSLLRVTPIASIGSALRAFCSAQMAERVLVAAREYDLSHKPSTAVEQYPGLPPSLRGSPQVWEEVLLRHRNSTLYHEVLGVLRRRQFTCGVWVEDPQRRPSWLLVRPLMQSVYGILLQGVEAPTEIDRVKSAGSPSAKRPVAGAAPLPPPSSAPLVRSPDSLVTPGSPTPSITPTSPIVDAASNLSPGVSPGGPDSSLSPGSPLGGSSEEVANEDDDEAAGTEDAADTEEDALAEMPLQEEPVEIDEEDEAAAEQLERPPVSLQGTSVLEWNWYPGKDVKNPDLVEATVTIAGKAGAAPPLPALADLLLMPHQKRLEAFAAAASLQFSLPRLLGDLTFRGAPHVLALVASSLRCGISASLYHDV